MDVMWGLWSKDPSENTYFYPVEKPIR